MYLMPRDISIKELREHLAEFADLVEHGESFRVIRRSKPSFMIMKIEEDASEREWATVIDFTDGGKKTGVPLAAAVETLKKMNK